MFLVVASTLFTQYPSVVFSLPRAYMYALCVSGAANTQGFTWKFFYYALYVNLHVCTVCIWRGEHVRFYVEVFFIMRYCVNLHVCTVCIWRGEHVRFCVDVFFMRYM